MRMATVLVIYSVIYSRDHWNAEVGILIHKC